MFFEGFKELDVLFEAGVVSEIEEGFEEYCLDIGPWKYVFYISGKGAVAWRFGNYLVESVIDVHV